MHFFLILQLWLAPFFNISSLSDLKYNLHKYREKSDFFGKNRIFSGKIGFFRENIGFFPKNRRFLPIFFRFFCRRFFHPKIFSTTTENRFFAEKSAEKIDFFVLAFMSSDIGDKHQEALVFFEFLIDIKKKNTTIK